MTILVLSVGAISIGTAQFVNGQDGSDSGGSVIGCVGYAVCKNPTISGSGGGGSGGQPTTNTATIIVSKQVVCNGDVGSLCSGPDVFQITVSGKNPTPVTFKGSATGTKVTLDAGQYTVSETASFGITSFTPSFSGNCVQDSPGSLSASGTIDGGDSQACIITNILQTH